MTHVLRNYLDSKGFVSIRISGGENATDSSFYKMHPRIKLYKHGVAQPGVLCIKPDSTVLYAWAIDPSAVCIKMSTLTIISAYIELCLFFEELDMRLVSIGGFMQGVCVRVCVYVLVCVCGLVC